MITRNTAPPQRYSLRGGRIHRLMTFRQIGTNLAGDPTVLLTGWCGGTVNMADVDPHVIGPTCRQCKRLTEVQ